MSLVDNLMRKTRAVELGLPVYLLGCLAMGGATREGFAMHGFLEVIGFGILVYHLLFAEDQVFSQTAKRLCALAVLLLFIAFLELVPLPPLFWTMLPGRDPIAAGFGDMGMNLPWLGVSLAPERSAYALISLIPALAILVSAMVSSRRSIDLCMGTVILFAVGSTILGFLQVASGNYPYQITNRGQPTGFFSNSNHLATLLLLTIPILAMVFRRVGEKVRSSNKRLALQFILVSVAGIVLAGLVGNGSRAAIVIGAAAIAGAGVVAYYGRKRSASPLLVRAGLVGLPLFAALLMVGVAFDILGAGGDQSREVSRSKMLANGLEAASTYFPFGSGVGSFPQVYPNFENADEVGTVFVNHAHNDYVELLIETGLIGLAVLGLFLLWYYRRAFRIWTENGQGVLFARLGTIGVAIVLLHSAVDYPARTIAIMSLLALFLAMISEPSLHGGSQRERRRRSKHRTINF